MLGETIFKIEHDDDFIKFYTFNGLWEMYHDQDCCESVTIDDINGDLDDLIGSNNTL